MARALRRAVEYLGAPKGKDFSLFESGDTVKLEQEVQIHDIIEMRRALGDEINAPSIPEGLYAA
jgi:hypothetical protein